MMTKEQCSAVLEQFSDRIRRDHKELSELKCSYLSMFGVDWDEEQCELPLVPTRGVEQL